MQDKPPSTKSLVIVLSPRIAEITYKGEVPISPKTIPIVTSSVAAVTLDGIVFIRKVVSSLRVYPP